jgi:hypothetical protein
VGVRVPVDFVISSSATNLWMEILAIANRPIIATHSPAKMEVRVDRYGAVITAHASLDSPVFNAKRISMNVPQLLAKTVEDVLITRTASHAPVNRDIRYVSFSHRPNNDPFFKT